MKNYPVSGQSDVGRTSNARYAISLVARSGYWHLHLIKPASEIPPRLYAGKPESTIAVMLFDVFGVRISDVKDPVEFFRMLSAFNLMWRAYDEVVDEARPTIATVSEKDLDDTPVYHKYAGQAVIGREALRIVLDSMFKIIPGKDQESRRRRDKIEGYLAAYRQRVAQTANNSMYQNVDVLPYGTALKTKYDVTRFLGFTGASICSAMLNLDDPSAIEVFAQSILVMQFGDDLLDWRGDWRDHDAKKKRWGNIARPNENLLDAGLEERPDEKNRLSSILNDTSKRGVSWLKEIGPDSFDAFQQRFVIEVDKVPPHGSSDQIKGLLSLTFNQIVPRAPESGWFYRWAKY